MVVAAYKRGDSQPGARNGLAAISEIALASSPRTNARATSGPITCARKMAIASAWSLGWMDSDIDLLSLAEPEIGSTDGEPLPDLDDRRDGSRKVGRR